MGKYKLRDTQSGFKTLLFTDKATSREIRLHSAYDPLAESERMVNSFKPGRSNVIVVAGLALGYHLNYLKIKFPDYIILILEKDSEVIEIARNYYPESLAGVSVISSSMDISTAFENIDISIIRGISAYIHRPSYLLHNKFYDSLLKDIREYISSRVSDLLTRFEFEESWISHIFQNIHYVYSSATVSTLFGKFRNIPGIIVSAGPSLKKNVRLLNNIRGSALIVCVDTALKVLQKYNVTPHLVMTLDSQKYSLKHFLGLRDTKPPLLADVVSYPRLLDYYEGRKIFSTTTKYYSDSNGNQRRETTPAWDWIEQFTGPIGDLQSGGSVATSVFDLLLNLGCSKIILVGQDLAYTGREIHCTGTHHNEDWLTKTSRLLNLESINQNVIRKRKIKYVDAFGGNKKVISDFVFDIYKFWFKNSAEKVSIPVINATEGGARVDNTQEKTLEEIIADLGSFPCQKSPEEILKQSLAENQDGNVKNPEILLNAVTSAVAELEELKLSSGKMLNERHSFDDRELLDLINTGSVSKLIMPFLSRTFVYLTRHPDLEQEKASGLLLSDISLSADKLIRMLKVCKKNLSEIR